MLPMGTIIAGCTILVSAFVIARTLLRHRGNSAVSRAVGAIALLAGAWNTFWHALRHLGEHWGQMALGSGLLMIVIGVCLLVPARLPAVLLRLLPLFAVALAVFAWHYGMAIYRL